MHRFQATEAFFKQKKRLLFFSLMSECECFVFKRSGRDGPACSITCEFSSEYGSYRVECSTQLLTSVVNFDWILKLKKDNIF